MAAPTSVRVEATSTTTTVVRWTYAGSAGLGVYRSLDGISYSLITSPLLPSTDTSYTDTGLAAATKYFYKLSDDGGATFSSVVYTYTHVCLDSYDGSGTFALPRFSGEPDPTQLGNELDGMAQRIEEVLGTRVLEPQQCTACPVDGALVLNCASGCNDWIVIADQDINSISMQFCENGAGGGSGTGGQVGITFIVPANTTRRIGGWSAGLGFSGDEGQQAPITTGSQPKQVKVALTCKCADMTGGAVGFTPGYSCLCEEKSVSQLSAASSGGGSPCDCVPSANGALTIKSCNAGNSLKCSSTKSLTLKVCGGRGPYTWSNTGSVNLSSTSGTSTTVTPPTNSGSAVVGTAYKEGYFKCNGCAAGTCNTISADIQVLRNCDDSSSGCSTVSPCGTEGPASAATCGCGAGSVGQAGCGASPPTCTNCGADVCSNYQAGATGGAAHVICDTRTAPMIAAGCNPCGLNEGATVSVTDAVGTVTTVILKV